MTGEDRCQPEFEYVDYLGHRWTYDAENDVWSYEPRPWRGTLEQREEILRLVIKAEIAYPTTINDWDCCSADEAGEVLWSPPGPRLFSEDDRRWNDWTFSADGMSARKSGYRIGFENGAVWVTGHRCRFPVSEDSDVEYRRVANELIRRRPPTAKQPEPTGEPIGPTLFLLAFVALAFFAAVML